MKPFFVLAVLFVGGCATPTPPPALDCGHRAVFYPDPGFEERWTRREREHLVAENRAVRRDCPAT